METKITNLYPEYPRSSDLQSFKVRLETPQDLELIAAEIKLDFNPIASIIISDHLGTKLLEQFNVIKSYSFGEWFPQTLHLTSEGLMIIKGSPILREAENHTKMLYPTFLSNVLKIEKVFVFDEVSTCSESAPLGSWVKVTAQCGLVFINPLFGPNVNNWGVRFPDMSNCYE